MAALWRMIRRARSTRQRTEHHLLLRDAEQRQHFPRSVSWRTATVSAGRSNHPPVAVPTASTKATSSAAVQGTAQQGSTAASSSSSARGHELEGNQVGFLRQVLRLCLDVDDDEEEMDMDGEDAIAPEGTRTSRRQVLKKSMSIGEPTFLFVRGARTACGAKRRDRHRRTAFRSNEDHHRMCAITRVKRSTQTRSGLGIRDCCSIASRNPPSWH